MEIWEPKLGYKLFKSYVNKVTRFSYRSFEVTGQENIPEDGVVIFAPNHCGTLMDALILLLPSNISAYGARADMFNTALKAKIMTFLRIVPIPRMRDGAEALKGSQQIIDKIIECLGHGVPFYLFSEGTHRAKRSLLPIKKGIFRIAVDAMKVIDKTVYVVPVGIEYGDYFRYRTTALISYGKPINVNAVVAEHNDGNEAMMYRDLTERLRRGISELITYIPDDEQFDGRWAMTRFLAAGPQPDRLSDRLKKNREIIANLDESRLDEALTSEKERRSKKISTMSLGYGNIKSRAMRKSLLWLLGLPLFIAYLTATLPILIPTWIIGHKIKDKTFINTVRFACRLAGAPIMLIIWATVFFCLLPWFIALPALLALLPSVSYYYDFLEFSRVLASDIRLAFWSDYKPFTK